MAHVGKNEYVKRLILIQAGVYCCLVLPNKPEIPLKPISGQK